MADVKRILLGLILLNSSYNSQAVTYKEALLGTILYGTAGATLGYGAQLLQNSQKCLQKTLICGSTAAIISGLIYLAKTPHFRAKRAQRIIIDGETSHLINVIKKHSQNKDRLLEVLKQQYIHTDFPLVRAAVALEDMQRSLTNALRILAHAKNDYPDQAFAQNADSYIQRASTMVQLVCDTLTIIKDQPSYVELRKAYEEKIAAEKLRYEISMNNMFWCHHHHCHTYFCQCC